MGWYPNKCAKVDDGSEFSVTEYYEKVCVPEGVIPIVIDVPRLRHVGASWGGGLRLYRRERAYQIAGIHLFIGRFTTSCRGTFEQKRLEICRHPFLCRRSIIFRLLRRPTRKFRKHRK